jgi:hypothetical protein
VKYIKDIFRIFRILLFAFLFSVCMVWGIVPILPKRKEEVVHEIIIAENELKDDEEQKVMLFKANV